MQALLLVAIPGSSVSMSTFDHLLGLFTAILGLSTAVLGLSVAMPVLFIAVPKLTIAVFKLSVAVLGLSILATAFVFVPGLSVFVLPSVSTPMLSGSSPLLFPVLSLPKTPMPNLATEKQKLDDIISEQSEKSKKISSEKLQSGKIKKAVLKKVFLSKAPLFPLLFPSSDIGKRKFDKSFINT